MAAVIHDLWARNDASVLIQPGAVGLDSPSVRDELTRYLPEGWTAVLEGDVGRPQRRAVSHGRGKSPVRPAGGGAPGPPARSSSAARRTWRNSRCAESKTCACASAWCSRASRWPSSNDALSQLSRPAHLSLPPGPTLLVRHAAQPAAHRRRACAAVRRRRRRAGDRTTGARRDQARPGRFPRCSCVSGLVGGRARRTSGAARGPRPRRHPRREEHRERGLDHGPQPAVRARRRPAPAPEHAGVPRAGPGRHEGTRSGSAALPRLEVGGRRPRGAESRRAPAPRGRRRHEGKRRRRAGAGARGVALAARSGPGGVERWRGRPRVDNHTGRRRREPDCRPRLPTHAIGRAPDHEVVTGAAQDGARPLVLERSEPHARQAGLGRAVRLLLPAAAV